jgi:hypothetical protein
MSAPAAASAIATGQVATPEHPAAAAAVTGAVISSSPSVARVDAAFAAFADDAASARIRSAASRRDPFRATELARQDLLLAIAARTRNLSQHGDPLDAWVNSTEPAADSLDRAFDSRANLEIGTASAERSVGRTIVSVNS